MVKLNLETGADGATTISGKDAFALKEAIKRCGGKWMALTKTWVIPAGNALNALENEMQLLNQTRLQEKVQQAFNKTTEGRALKAADDKMVMYTMVMQCLAEKQKTGKYQWVCCDKCIVLDWTRQHTTCWDCGHDDGQGGRSTFRISGRLYTGD